jgi:capsular exopolysaccharide synthesis family protein
MGGFRGAVRHRDSAVPAGAPEWPVEVTLSDDTHHVRRVWAVLVDERRTIAVAFVASAALLTAMVLLAGEERVYEARAQLLVEPEPWKPIDYGAPADSGVGPEASYYATQFRILRSRSLARRTLTLLKPAPDVSGSAAPKAEAPQQRPAPGTARGHPAATTAEIPAASVDGFVAALTVVQAPESRILDVRFRSSDPQYAARALNTHLDAYIAMNADVSQATAQQASRWLVRQIEDQRASVKKREAALHEFERRTGVGVSEQLMANQRMSEFNSTLMRVRAQRIARESAFEQLERARRDARPLNDLAALVPTPVVQQLAIELASLQRREQEMVGHYGERHPERVKTRDAIDFTERRLRAEVANALEATSREVEALRLEERRISAVLASQNAQAASAGRRLVDHETLRRELESERALLERMQARASELHLAADAAPTHIRVIDAAEVPTRPIADARWRNLALAIGTSLVLAVGLALGRRAIDERLRSPEDVTAELGLPFLGIVPEASGLDLRAYMVGGNKPAPVFREAMRDLRTHVLCTPRGQDSRVLLVTSTRPAEGKTMVAANLAAGLAKVGHRVLLMDLDLRHPALHDAFGTPAEPGLAELLAGSVASRDTFRETGVKDLWILTAGRPLSSPGDLLGSAAFKQLMQSLPSSFDRIVIDSPPVMACADASTIAHHQVGIVFVVGADRTDRRSAQAALDRLEAVGAHFVGGVLNRVDVSRNGSAYYPLYDETSLAYLAPRAGGKSPGRA